MRVRDEGDVAVRGKERERELWVRVEMGVRLLKRG